MKGQKLRLLIGPEGQEKCIASAQSCNVHIGIQTESKSSKDDDDDWEKVDVMGKAWDASAECNFEISDPVTGSTGITVPQIIALIGTEISLKFNTVNGSHNRTTTAGVAMHGKAFITDLQITSQNRQTVKASIQFTGNGSLS